MYYTAAGANVVGFEEANHGEEEEGKKDGKGNTKNSDK